MAKHAFFLNKGGSGGGGGTGGFALIKIEYPEGQEVTVTFDGETTTAPDTSGLWMYGCEETGTYTIAITGTTAEVEVEITTQGQIESVWISPQVINYAMLYYLGEQFETIPEEYDDGGALVTGGWEKIPGNNIAGTKNFVSTVGYDKLCVYFLNAVNSSSWSITPGARLIDSNNIAVEFHYSDFPINVKKYGIFDISSYQSLYKISDYPARTSTGTVPSNTIFKNTYIVHGYVTGGNMYEYCFALIKNDNISGLSQYGSDIATILSNATDLFADTTALNWMCLNCTGDFMISALSNTNFVNAMNTSPNKSILVANEHWNRFIALLSV